jgi:hypothetical protein
LQTKLVAQVIFPTIWMQPHHHAERVTRILWRSLPYLKCILWLSVVCFVREIPSVKIVDIFAPARYPKCRGLWLFSATSFARPLSASPCCYRHWFNPVKGRHQPVIHYWIEQTALLQSFLAGSRLLVLTASSGSHLNSGTHWPPLPHHKV